jgi:NitT/TauT family transport system ATP-binding protein
MQVELLKILARTGTTALFVTHQIDEAVFLSNRVAVFSARPARVKQIVEVDLPPQRSLEMKLLPRFRELQDEIWRSIYEETMHFVAAQ